ncbi:MAG: hypothetical protein R2795_19240 [Saprospiraceae bacterium]
MATSHKKETTIEKTATYVAKQLNTLHDTALELTDSLVEESLAAGKKWNHVLGKALKTGTAIMGQQQEMVFDTLDALKKQYQKGTNRAYALVKDEMQTTKETVEQAFNEVKAEISETIEKVEKTVKKPVAKKPATPKAAATKAVKTAKATTAKATASAKKAVAATAATVKETAAEVEAAVKA